MIGMSLHENKTTVGDDAVGLFCMAKLKEDSTRIVILSNRNSGQLSAKTSSSSSTTIELGNRVGLFCKFETLNG